MIKCKRNTKKDVNWILSLKTQIKLCMIIKIIISYYFNFFGILWWLTRLIQTFLNLHFANYVECNLGKITSNSGNLVTFLFREFLSSSFEFFMLHFFKRKLCIPWVTVSAGEQIAM